MSFVKTLASKKATGGGGNNIVDGAGALLVKDIILKKGFKDPQTLIFEFYVKESRQDPAHPTVAPNPPGTTASIVKKLTTKTGAAEQAMGILESILGPEFAAMTEAEKETEMSSQLRIGPDGYTKQGTECPAKGVEVRYTTYHKNSNEGKDLTIPKLEHVPFTAETVTAGRALIDGAAAEADSSAV